jgi:mycothiol synthase
MGESDKWVFRGYKEGDIPDLVTLVNLVDETYTLDWGTSESEMTHDLRGPRQEPERQIVVAEMDGRPGFVGYGRVGYDNDEEKGERIYYLNVTIHPDLEGRGLEDDLAARLIEIVRGYEADPKPEGSKQAKLKAYVNEQVHHVRRLWEGLGLKQVRYFQVMQRLLDEPIDEPAPVDGVFVRLYRRPEDNAAALEAFNNSFSDHYDHHDSPPEDWEHFTGLPTTRPDLSWLAQAHGLDGVEPGKIVGFCICAVFDEDNKRKGVLEGWIDLLGTTRECRRKGLGRSILMHGLHSLRAAGLDTALLGVDSESLTGANKLYESVGFRTRSREVQYECLLEEIRAE